MLIQFHDSLAKQVRWVSSRSFQFQNRPELSVNEHVAIFKAFERGEGEKARVLMETHTNESMERSLSKFVIEERQSEIWNGAREEKRGPEEKYSGADRPEGKQRGADNPG
jgi:DNA-binding FadR family transcriptional regulator